VFDAYIIDSLRREQEQQPDTRPRLWIEPPPFLEEPERAPAPEEREERGVAEIDFTL
jgi:hypothetical protein